MNTLQDREEGAAEPTDTQSAWVAERLGNLMAEHGVAERQQAGLLNELCGLSLSQARRKLRGAVWSFDEVLTVVRHFGVSLDRVFSGSPGADAALVESVPVTLVIPQQEAEFLLDAQSIPCKILLGSQVVGAPAKDKLLAAQNQAGWQVGMLCNLNRQGVEAPYYWVSQVLLTPASSAPSIRIAVLDDDIGTTETLVEWFNAAGYVATGFTSSAALLASPLEGFDAFIVDYLLSGGDSSQAIIKHVRQTLPAAPILLLTGKMREGQVSESDLITVLRTENVIFFEKPVRPFVLAATIDKELDQLASRQGAG